MVAAPIQASAQTAPEDPSPIAASPADQPADPPAEARDKIALTVPLLRGGQPLGEIDVATDMDGNAEFGRDSLLAALAPLLSEEGLARLQAASAGRALLTPDALAGMGLELRFNFSRIEAELLAIDPVLQRVQALGETGDDLGQLPTTVDPAGFSAFLNLAGNLEYNDGLDTDGLRNPDILGFGTIRAGRFALQFEGGLTDVEPDRYGLYRRFVRGIYDIEGRSMRISAGDLQTGNIGILGSQLVGGIGLERSREIFRPFEPAFDLGGRRLQIASPSTVEIFRNGELIQTFPVDQGVYDLDQLPLVGGSNDVEVIIRDAAGRTETINFDYFFDPVDLRAGDYQYGIYLGSVSDFSGLQPSYSGELTASGFYRRAFTPTFLLGGGVQLSEAVQSGAVEMSWVPQAIPGVIEAEMAVSNSDLGFGFASRMGYRWAQRTATGGRQLAFNLDYETNNFRLVGRPLLIDEERFSVGVNYSQNLTPVTYASVGASYFKRGSTPARTVVFIDAIHQFSSRLRGTAGVEYGENDGVGSAFGVRLALSLQFGARSRADASVESRREVYRAGFSRAIENNVGSLGYDVTYQTNQDTSTADAALRYRGNRFDGRLLVSGSGDGFGNIADRRRAQLQVATSLAFADGLFGVGRPITDGFALVAPHPAIDADVIVGNGLNDGEYQGRSGLLGAAVVSDVTAYQVREILYDFDVIDAPYDTGEGVDRLRLATGGGAKIVVGNARFVSAIGTLADADGPVKLVTGVVTSPSDPDFGSVLFLTNSVGRFSAVGFAPGETYLVELTDGRQFPLTIPEGTGGLYRAGTIILEETKP